MMKSVAQYIRTALEQDLFKIEYQPQFCLANSIYEIASLESLLDHDPAICDKKTLFEEAIKFNLIIELGYWILEKVLQQLRTWIDKQLVNTSFQISVNVFGEQLADEYFCEKVHAMTMAADILPSQITLELLETTLIDDVNINKIHRLVDMGFNISIDDFGTGYSSLARLKQLPIHEIKIDKLFLENITDEDQDRSLITAMYQLVSALDKFTVVEGVESAEQFILLRDIGFTCFQGHFFNTKESVEDIEQTIRLVNSVCSHYYKSDTHIISK